jgi:predicted O-methyltransferase YrrM
MRVLGVCVVVDNLVRRGSLAIPEKVKANSRIQESRKVVEMVGKDSRVKAVVMQMVGENSYDAFLLAVVTE